MTPPVITPTAGTSVSIKKDTDVKGLVSKEELAEQDPLPPRETKVPLGQTSARESGKPQSLPGDKQEQISF